MAKKIVRLTEDDLSKVIGRLVEQQMEREIVFPDIPTPEVEVSGGFTDRGGRKRALPKLGDFGGNNE